MNRIITLVVLTAAAALLLPAVPPSAPEIDPGMGTAAFTFLTGAAVLIRARARR